MFRASTVFVFLMAFAVAVASVPIPSQAAADRDSAPLTEYLHNHRLPAVGAQITTGADGSRTVVLYGFVATQRGFDDAAARTRDYLHDPYVRIINRVKIEPELLALNKPSTRSASSADNSQASSGASAPSVADNTPPPGDVGDIQQYEAQNQTVDPYGIPGQSSVIGGSSVLAPLIGGLLLYGALNSLGSSYYSPPPSYYVPSVPPPVYPYRPPFTGHHHHRGSYFHSGFASPAPMTEPYMPHYPSLAPLAPRYVPPSLYTPPPLIQHPYFGGYHGSFGGGSTGFGGRFSGGFHGGHR
jgi:hypothetical protein